MSRSQCNLLQEGEGRRGGEEGRGGGERVNGESLDVCTNMGWEVHGDL